MTTSRYKTKEAELKAKQAKKKYIQDNVVKAAFSLNRKTNAHYIEIYDSIPNKIEWFKKCLDEYEKKTLKEQKKASKKSEKAQDEAKSAD